MALSTIKKIILFVPNKLVTINSNISKVINLTETADRTLTYVTKVTGATTGAAGVAKGSIDFVEALACQDNVCVIVSAVGVAADTLQFGTSFIPGPNITSTVTLPVSMGCKVFVWCCKRSKLPWGGC